MQTLSFKRNHQPVCSCREIESQLALQPQSKRTTNKRHYAACDATSRAAVEMVNAPDWTIELADQFYQVLSVISAYGRLLINC